MHEKRAVAADRDARPIGRGEFGAEDAGDAEPHRAKPHAADQRGGATRLAELKEPVVMHADVADEDRVLGQRPVDLVRGALRVDRGGVVDVAGRDFGLPFAPPAVDRGEPGLPRRRDARRVARLDLGEKLAQEGAHIGHQAERDRVVAGDLVGIDIDVDQLGRRDGERVARESTTTRCGRRTARRAPATRRLGASPRWPGKARRATRGPATACDWCRARPVRWPRRRLEFAAARRGASSSSAAPP